MTPGLLLVRVTTAPLPVAAALSRTVPWVVPPTATFVPLNDTEVTVVPGDGCVGDPEWSLQPAKPAHANASAANCSPLACTILVTSTPSLRPSFKRLRRRTAAVE
jgi:hypothetical protein